MIPIPGNTSKKSSEGSWVFRSVGSESSIGFPQKYNIPIGVLIITVVTSLLCVLLPLGFLVFGDIYLAIGCCLGLYVTFKFRKESESHLKTGLIVGLAGSVLTMFFISAKDIYTIDSIIYEIGKYP